MEIASEAMDFEYINDCVVMQIDQPYVEDLTNPLELGTCININGFVKPDCTRFVFIQYNALLPLRK